ncbi:Succinate dehydrogenase assembly factor 1, mitochondrial [Ceratocystis lukuohia]|uniref:Succinate dehydrogenase assembly factor 1, mitochondrial n=1 Tax=Ceratocystis lukuohia TaxID=2019550 RepID=A0ABR4MNB4_9PEZI
MFAGSSSEAASVDVFKRTSIPLQYGGSRKHFEQFARAEFNKYRKVEKRDFATIEYFLRKGTKQLELYSEAAIKDVR